MILRRKNGVNISVEVKDNLSGVKKVEFYLEARKVAERNRPYEGSIYVGDISGLKEGRNNITIKAYDNSGKTGNVSQLNFTLNVEKVLGIKGREILPKEATTPVILPKEKNLSPHRP